MDTRSDPYMDQGLTWSFNGPYRDPKIDLLIFEKIPGYFYILYILHPLAPLNLLKRG